MKKTLQTLLLILSFALVAGCTKEDEVAPANGDCPSTSYLIKLNDKKEGLQDKQEFLSNKLKYVTGDARTSTIKELESVRSQLNSTNAELGKYTNCR